MSVADNIPAALYRLTLVNGYNMVYANPVFHKYFQYEKDISRNSPLDWMQMVHPQDAEKVRNAYQTVARKAVDIKIEYRVITPVNSVLEVLDRAGPVFDAQGHVIALDGLLVDLTETNKARRNLDRTQMLQSIGKLSAGIAHEINTPIQFIGDNIHFLNDALSQLMVILKMYQDHCRTHDTDDTTDSSLEKIVHAQNEADLEFLCDEIPKAIEQSSQGIKHITSMVAAMRDFSRIDERRKSSVDINKSVCSTITLCRNEIKYVADIETQLDPDLPRVYCCHDEILQVILNLVINAAHSIEDKLSDNKRQRGKISLATERIGDNIRLSITDTGTGINPDIRHRIFEPFFTTKKDGKGTGQGLKIVRSIVVEKHNGTIDIDTKPGQGTTFTITLPVDNRDEQQSQ